MAIDMHCCSCSLTSLLTILSCLCAYWELGAALYKWEEVSEGPIIKLNDEWDDPALYYTLPSILEVWQSSSVHYLREARAVLNLFKNRCFHFPKSWDEDSGEPRRPFINIEGYSKKIRDFIAGEVASALGGRLLLSPPACLVPLKPAYGEPSHRLHLPFRALGCYATAHAVQTHWGNTPVVLTGYWNDQTATTMADIFINMTTPDTRSTLFEFPKDLLKPDLVVFLDTLDHAPDSREEGRPSNWRIKFTETFLRFRKIRLERVVWFGGQNVTNTILNLIEKRLGDKEYIFIK